MGKFTGSVEALRDLLTPQGARLGRAGSGVTEARKFKASVVGADSPHFMHAVMLTNRALASLGGEIKVKRGLSRSVSGAPSSRLAVNWVWVWGV